MYVCGPTVYDFAHIGNARAIVVFDLVYRVLQRQFSKVTYARNITDVDDKINAAAIEQGVDIDVITEKTTAAFHRDMAALGVLAPTIEPRATDHIPQMVTMIKVLIEKNHAYEAGGNVLFHVPSMESYGALSGRDRDEQIAGARVDVAPYKKDPADFVLWKPSTKDLPGWDSPWGRGRPGWHLECSVMSREHLGQPFDIHGGGLDLVFPHHENEIAQSQCAHDETLATFWMHNGYLMVEGEKMSKSLGNVVLVHDLLKRVPGEAIRLALLMTHYRKPMDWTEGRLSEARAQLLNWYRLMPAESAADESNLNASDLEEFDAALADDLKTPAAIAAMNSLADQIQALPDGPERNAKQAALQAAGRHLGILQSSKADWFQWLPVDFPLTASKIDARLSDRIKARVEKDYAAADQIRDELTQLGIALQDGPDGTSWQFEG
jgi:cysteinyl-tRNA synthetase